VDKYCRIALERMGISLLGCIPVEKKLTQPNLHQVVEEINGTWLNGEKYAVSTRIDKVMIGAMAARGIVDYLLPGVLVVTAGDREDIMLAAIAAEGVAGKRIISGIILTRDTHPHPKLMDMIAKTDIPVVVSSEESYVVASKINNMTVKTQPSDADKIPIIKDLITKNIDLDVIRAAFRADNS
ncbi:MAG TPA: hypothetical protein DCX06_08500, partial [Opitutae bacterium]|nr:hypothetical protein [Opitutae bacterium]